MIQTTAAISRGSSGGPLLGAKGEVLGVTTLKVVGGENLNLAIPVEKVTELLRKPGPLQSLASAAGEPREYTDLANTNVKGRQAKGSLGSN